MIFTSDPDYASEQTNGHKENSNPKNKELYKDHDSIGDYMERLVLRPLRNLMHGTIDRDHEYYIKEEEEVNEYSEEE